MQKIVLDVILKPIANNGDILIYDDKDKCFIEQSKEDFLKEKTLEIVKLNKEIETLKAQNEEFKKQMSQMAKIIKERVI